MNKFQTYWQLQNPDTMPSPILTLTSMATIASKAKGSAPGQYLGYALQPVRLCYHLLTCQEGSAVSIEYLDDVAVAQPNGRTILEQTKSALTQNPVSDWSVDLWKTFANWIDNINSGLVDPNNTTFQIYVTPLKSGNWAQRFSNTNFIGDVPKALSDFQNAVAGLSGHPSSYEYIQKLLESDEDTLGALITNFRLTSDNDPLDPIRDRLKITVPNELMDMCCSYAIGHAKETADKLIRNHLPAVINAYSYQQSVRTFIQTNNLSKLLPSFAPLPADETIENTLDESPLFVRQLNLVDMPHHLVVRAISNLLQSSADKTHWAEKGLIVNESLTQFDQDLTNQHELKKLEIEDLNANRTPEARGRLLYTRCVSQTRKLEGRELPGHFVPGSYNDLANRLKLGWHPDFLSLLVD